jgi:hypothetical protein
MKTALFPVVLSGGLAVPCHPKPADAGLNGTLSSVRCESSLESAAAMKAGSGGDGHREPRQDRKVATVNGLSVSHRVPWLEPLAFLTLSPAARRSRHGRN